MRVLRRVSADEDWEVPRTLLVLQHRHRRGMQAMPVAVTSTITITSTIAIRTRNHKGLALPNGTGGPAR